MKLQLERSQHPFRTTQWRPIVRVTGNGERLNEEQLRNALSKEYTDIGLEDSYNKRRLLGEFVINRSSLVVADKRAVYDANQAKMGPLSVLASHTRIDPTATVGSFVEIQPRVRLEEDTVVGDRSALLKGAIVKSGARLGSVIYAAQNSFFGPGVTVGTGGIYEKGAVVGRDSVLMNQVRMQRGATVGEGSELEDSVDLGRSVRIGKGVFIGEGAEIGHYTVVEEGAWVGPEAIVGDMSKIYPTAWVLAGSEIPRGTKFLGSGLKAPNLQALNDFVRNYSGEE